MKLIGEAVFGRPGSCQHARTVPVVPDDPAHPAVFIGYDPREPAATYVLVDSLVQHAFAPLAITPLVTSQLERQGFYTCAQDPRQSTAFSFTHFLLPKLIAYEGWAVFMDCYMLCRSDIA
jgi:hypothetical protein